MTEEQIKQKAEKHADAYATPDLEDSFRTDIYEANKDGYIAGATEATKELEAQIEKMKKYMDCSYCEYVNDKDECHQCNYLEKTRWTLKKEIKEND